MGDLQSVTSKIEYFTMEGRKTAYLSISFAEIDGVVDGKKVRIERPIEFFMPTGQQTGDHQWITSSMRLLSMAARSGSNISNALADLRDVVWDKGAVRCGFVEKLDGAKAPRFHDSEVAAIAYSLQEILKRRGFLDYDGNQIPVGKLAAKFASAVAEDVHEVQPEVSQPAPAYTKFNGSKCPECNAMALRKVDGCKKCENCGFLGSCG